MEGRSVSTPRTGYVQLAGVRQGDHYMSVPMDDKGRVIIDKDVWVAILDPGTLLWTLRSLGVSETASREVVLAKLNLAGYWPGAYALTAYLDCAE